MQAPSVLSTQIEAVSMKLRHMQQLTFGLSRCLAALAEWERLSALVRREWGRVEPPAMREMAPVAAHAAWHMGHWQVCIPQFPMMWPA